MNKLSRNRSAALATAAAVLAIPFAAAPAQSVPAPSAPGASLSSAPWRAYSPVGVWEGKLEIPEGTFTIYISFDRKGKACLQGGGGAKGTGYWYRTGLNTFSYRITEKFAPAPDGSPQGHAEIVDDATQSGEKYHAVGVSKVFDAAGKHVATYEGEADFVRTSTTDPGRVCRA